MYGYAVVRLIAEEDSPSAGCVCGEPGTWSPAAGPPRHRRARRPAEAFVARDLFEALCDGCFRRAVPEPEREEWVRRRD